MTSDQETGLSQGPLLSRGWVGGVWEERPTAGGPLDPPRAHLQALRAHVKELWQSCPEVVLPDPGWLRQGVMRYSDTGPTMLHAVLLDDDHSASLGTLGACLARLHAICPSDEVPRQSPVRRLEGAATPARATLLEALEADGRLIASARSVRPDAAHVLLHGRFSTGAVFLGRDGPKLLSGIEQWSGPPEADLGHLLGELVELAAEGALSGNASLGQLARRYAVALLQGYGAAPSSALTDWTAWAVVCHLLLNADWRAMNGLGQPDQTEWLALLQVLGQALDELWRDV